MFYTFISRGGSALSPSNCHSEIPFTARARNAMGTRAFKLAWVFSPGVWR